MQIHGVTGFDWDDGNVSKCQKHGVSLSEIETAFHGEMKVFPDLAHSQNETRYIGLGKTEEGRNLFVCFTLRQREGEAYIRPVSARYMHRKEVEYYEKAITRPQH
ncbi:BrnT family toxin [Candidatus Methylospira mobilis]|uniref:BrnT family toxin n=2 Tax=Candidatus Methylospira mobilis TaxID=1808979 RepID=A0A5Q0BT13_9GAMM|nr:BrnT family toxin [Candidatus Methylospira mobilis]